MHSYTVKWGENPITSTIFSEQEILACLVPKMREEEPKTENPLRGPNQYSEFGLARCYLRRLQCTVEKPLNVLNPKMGGEDLQVRNPMRESMILVFNPCGTKMGAEESH